MLIYFVQRSVCPLVIKCLVASNNYLLWPEFYGYLVSDILSLVLIQTLEHPCVYLILWRCILFVDSFACISNLCERVIKNLTVFNKHLWEDSEGYFCIITDLSNSLAIEHTMEKKGRCI